MTFEILLVPCLITLYGIYMLYRNNKVFEYRSKLLEQIFRDHDYKDRLVIYNSVSYNRMMLIFWKPLDSWFKDTNFNVKG